MCRRHVDQSPQEETVCDHERIEIYLQRQDRRVQVVHGCGLAWRCTAACGCVLGALWRIHQVRRNGRKLVRLGRVVVLDLLEEFAALGELLEAPHARQKRLLEEPVYNLGDARLLLCLFIGYVLETSQVLVKVNLINSNTPVKILICVRELHDQVVSFNLLLNLILRGRTVSSSAVALLSA